MSTTGKKDKRLNLKITPVLREEFQAAAHLRGGTMSSLLYLYIVKVVREEKERNAEEFEKALAHVRALNAASAAGADDEVRMPDEEFDSLHEEVNKKNKRSPGAAAKRKAGTRKS